MTLSQAQRAFAKHVGALLTWAYIQGYEVTLGDAYRSPEEAARLAALGVGIRDSLHCRRLAIDLNLFLHGEYQTDREAYRPLGDYWESLDPAHRWGGHFTTRNDPFHFERTWGGG